MESVEVDGLRITYERAGTGPPLVLLHGYVGDGPTLWRRQLETLSDEFTVIAWDAPGAGQSSDPPESFGISGYADALAGFIQELGLASPHVAGLSFGGILALALYGRHPAIPATLTLASAYAGWAGSSPRGGHPPSGTGDGPGGAAPRRVRGHPPPDHVLRGTPAEAVDEFGESMRTFRPTGFRALARASAESVREVLARVTVPTLLVYGGRDVRAPPRRRGPPRGDHRVNAGRPPGRWPRLQHRGPGGVQPGGPDLPPRPPPASVNQVATSTTTRTGSRSSSTRNPARWSSPTPRRTRPSQSSASPISFTCARSGVSLSGTVCVPGR